MILNTANWSAQIKVRENIVFVKNKKKLFDTFFSKQNKRENKQNGSELQIYEVVFAPNASECDDIISKMKINY